MTSSSAPAAAPGPVPSGREQITSAAADRSLSEIEVAWADHLGHTLGKRLPAAGFLDQAANERVGFCDATLSWDVVANVHEGGRLTGWHTGFPDLYAAPDLDTFRLLPWRPGAGQVLGDIVDHEGNPVRTAPRTVLRRVTERLAELGYHAEIGVEIEFFLLDLAGQPLAAAVHCYSLEKLNELDPILTSITQGLAGYLPVEAVTSEYGPGQLEINIHHRDPIGAADDAFRLKYALRALARAAGARVTFMANYTFSKLMEDTGGIDSSTPGSNRFPQAGLGRERVYLSGFARVAACVRARPVNEVVLAAGQVAVDAVDALARYT